MSEEGKVASIMPTTVGSVSDVLDWVDESMFHS